MLAGIMLTEPVPGEVEKWARVHQIGFRRVAVSKVGTLVAAQNIPAERPIDGLVLADITGTCDRGISLANAANVELTGIEVTGFTGPLITTHNVTGTGLEKPAAPK